MEASTPPQTHAQLASLGKDRIASYLKSHVSEIPAFLTSISPGRDADVPSFQPHEYFDKCMWILAGESPGHFFSKLQSNVSSSSSVCGAVWKQNATAFKCRTCEKDPTCAICVACFQAGDHEGHDYQMIRTGGGCCDCGDAQAWAVDGFCPNHTGVQEGVDPSLEIPVADRTRMAASFRGVLDALTNAEYTPEEMNVVEARVSGDDLTRRHVMIRGALEWLDRLAKFHDSIKRVIAQAWITLDDETGNGSGSLLFRLMSHPMSSPEVLHKLLYSLTQDVLFKRRFALKLIQLYPKFMKRAFSVNGPEPLENPLLDSFTVQVFTVANLTPDLVIDHGLLDTLLGCLRDGLSRAVPLPSTNRMAPAAGVVDCDHPSIHVHAYWRVLADMGFALAHPAVSQWFTLTEFERGFGQWLGIVNMTQGMNPTHRITGAHVEYESESWMRSFLLELELLGHMDHIIRGIHIGTQTFPRSTPVEETPAPKPLTEELNIALQRVIKSTVAALLSHFGTSRAPTYDTAKRWNPHEHPVEQFVVSKDTLSYHVPLHRVLGRIVTEIARTYQGDADTVFAELSEDFMRRVIEGPLRAKVMLAQGRSGTWVRNGQGAWKQAVFYRSVHLHHVAFDPDMAVLQAAACRLPQEEFMSILIDRFELHPFLKLGTAYRTDEPLVTVMEEFLLLVLHVITDRTMTGASVEELVRRRILHRLYLAPHTHSALTKSISAKLVEHSSFEPILNEVSEFKTPSGMHAGKYELKPELWSEFDPYNMHYSVRDRQKAMENFLQYRRMKHGNGDLDDPARLTPDVFTSHLAPTVPAFSELSSLPHTRVLHRVLYIVLSESLDHTIANDGGFSEGLLMASLHLLLLAARSAPTHPRAKSHEPPLDGPPTVTGLYSVPYDSNNIFTNLTIPVLIAKKGQEDASPSETRSLLDVLLKLRSSKECAGAHSTIESIFDLIAEHDSGPGGALIKQHREDRARKLAEKNAAAGSSEGAAGGDARSARLARQRAIMAQMQRQQAAFSALHVSSETTSASGGDTAKASAEAAHDGEGDEDVCGLCDNSDPSIPLALVAVLEPTYITGLATRTGRVGGRMPIQVTKRTRHPDPSPHKPPQAPAGSAAGGSGDQSGAGASGSRTDNPGVQALLQSPANTVAAAQSIDIGESDSEDSEGAEGEDAAGDPLNQALEYMYALLYGEEGEEVQENQFGTAAEEAAIGIPLDQFEVMDEGDESEDVDDEMQGMETGQFLQNLLRGRRGTDASAVEAQRAEDSDNAPPPNETYRDSSRTGGIPEIFIRTCGHAVHSTCFERYIETLKSKEARGEMYEGQILINIHQGEFLCPQCRAVGNTLLPLSSSMFVERPPREADPDAMMMTSTAPTDYPPADDTAVVVDRVLAHKRGSGEDGGKKSGDSIVRTSDQFLTFASNFATQVRAQQLKQNRKRGIANADPRTVAHLMSSMAANISAVEIASRRFVSESVMACVDAKSTRQVRELFLIMMWMKGTAIRHDNPDADYHRLRDTFTSGMASHFGDALPNIPLLSLGMFETLVRLLVLSPSISTIARGSDPESDPQVRAVLDYVHFVYTAHVCQGLVQALYQGASRAAPRSSTQSSAPSYNGVIAAVNRAIGGPCAMSQSAVVSAVESLVPTFLRRAALLVRTVCPNYRFRDSDLELDTVAEARELLAYLRLPTAGAMLREEKLIQPFTTWATPFEYPLGYWGGSAVDAQRVVHTVSAVRPELWIAPCVPFGFVTLAERYQDLYQQFSDAVCANCKTTPRSPVLCLLCGAFLCHGKDCCVKDGEAEAIGHTHSCCSGIGVLLLLRESTVLLTRADRIARWGSFYLDAHGEEDPQLKRGRPLTLSLFRRQQLEALFLEHKFDHDSHILGLSIRRDIQMEYLLAAGALG